MKNKSETVVLPFNSARIKDKYLVSNALGAWDFLDNKEFRELNSLRISEGSPLGKRLLEKGIMAGQEKMGSLLEGYRTMNAHLFTDTSLHIAVVTTKCNLRCSYCQTRVPEPQDMTPEVASRVLKYLFDVRNPTVTLEFQGGEPLMNWPVLSFLVEHARKFNTIGKTLKIAMVSNLLLLDDEKMKFLCDHDVEVCTSLDGPKGIHDANRVLPGGKGSYDQVVAKVKRMKSKFGRRVHLLPTITRASLAHYKEIIDEYVALGEHEISLRPVNNMGAANSAWADLGYDPDAFIRFYRDAMEYILQLNKKGVNLCERTARVILTKVLSRQDPGYVELMSPCGAGRNTIVYMPDGSCYPCDESRMTGEEMFKLGNIQQERYEDMMKKDNLLHLLEASCIDLWAYASVFSPWMGTCPVVNYALQKNMVPKLSCSPLHKTLTGQFQYLFEKLLDDSAATGIFKSWLKGGAHEAGK